MAEQIVGGGSQLTCALLGRELGHHLTGLLAVVGDPAAVEIGGQSDESLDCQPVGHLFDVVGQSPPFLDDDDGGPGS